MQARRLSIPDLIVIEPKLFEDNRGNFYESYNQRVYAELLGQDIKFVQDNHVYSIKNVIRGMHFQIRQAQGKLIRVISGVISDVAVDTRPQSPTFGKWESVQLSAENKRQLYIPPGFAHGYLVLSDHAEVLYKTTDYWAPEHERCIIWNDSFLNITWPLTSQPIISARDAQGLVWSEALRCPYPVE